MISDNFFEKNEHISTQTRYLAAYIMSRFRSFLLLGARS